MSDKHRDLPSWMLGGGDAKRNEQGEFRKSVRTLGKKKKARVQRETLYFMNEAELVDAALRVLTEGGGGNSGTGIPALKTEAEKTQDVLAKTNGESIKRKKKLMFESDTEVESSDCELSKKTYIAETDPEDLAEKATLPYAPALEPGDQGTEGVADRDAEESALPGHGVAPEPDRGNASLEASDDEALRLVREIFFT